MSAASAAEIDTAIGVWSRRWRWHTACAAGAVWASSVSMYQMFVVGGVWWVGLATASVFLALLLTISAAFAFVGLMFLSAIRTLEKLE